MGLYRSGGLATLKNMSSLQAEKNKKHFQNIFRGNNLSIIIKRNKKMSTA